MGFLEEEILNLKLVETFGINTARNIQDSWFRFLDDCIILWKPDFGSINSFIGILNILHPKIKFRSGFGSDHWKISEVVSDHRTNSGRFFPMVGKKLDILSARIHVS